MQDKTRAYSMSIKSSTMQGRIKLTSIQFSSLLLAIVIVIGLTLSGCESDPILAPQAVVDEGGSYGNAKLPASKTNDTKKAVQAEQNGKAGANRAKRTNPKLF